MRMRTYHGDGALLLVLAMVMAMMLSTGICTGTAPAPTPNWVQYPKPEHRCSKVLANSGCDQKACNRNCFNKLKGAGACVVAVKGSVVRELCWCSYPCKLSPPPSAW